MPSLSSLRRKLEAVIEESGLDDRFTLAKKQKARAAFIESALHEGGQGFLERVKKFGTTEKGEELQFLPWFCDLLLLIGDLRLGHTLTTGCAQLGKAEPVDSLVLTPTGWVRMGDVTVGMPVTAGDGADCRVIGVYPQGVKPIFRITTTDNAQAECCDEHLWYTQTSDGTAVLPLAKIRHSLSRNYRIPTFITGQFEHCIRSVEYVGEKPAQCIAIDHPSHLYVTDNYIVTHNTTSHNLFIADCVTSGKLNTAWFFDSLNNLNANVPMQFKPIVESWVSRMYEAGYNFSRAGDRRTNTRYQVDQTTAIFSYVSTSRLASKTESGRAVAGGSVVSFQADVAVLEERSQYPPGAADPIPRRLDASMVPTRPVRELGTPGGGQGIEAAMTDCHRYFYPHYHCPHCQQHLPLDPKGCLLRPSQRQDLLGQMQTVYLSEAGRPQIWWHTDPRDPVETALFCCSNCGTPITDEVRLAARMRCRQTGISSEEFLASLPQGVPDRAWKIGIHISPLSRDESYKTLAPQMIKSGFDAVNPDDWQQQRLGHHSEHEVSSITLAMIQRSIAAPKPDRKPDYVLAAVDFGRSQDWMTIAAFYLPENAHWFKPAELAEKTIREVLWSGGLIRDQIPEKLRAYGVTYGLIDNEPSRESSMKLCQNTVLEMADQRDIPKPVTETTVMDGGIEYPCWVIRNAKFMNAVFEGFVLTADDGHPLYRLPADWERWIGSPSDISPITQMIGPWRDNEGYWNRPSNKVDDIFFAHVFLEAAFYIQLQRPMADYTISGVGVRPVQSLLRDL